MSDEIDVHPVADECWTVERPKLLNASTISTTAGQHDYTTLARLTAEMRGIAKPDVDPNSALIRRGHALEDDAIDEIQKLRPTWRITPNRNHYVDWTHRIGATPDALVIAPERDGVGALQIKVVSRPVFKKKWPDETPPTGYLMQLATEMMLIPGCTWGAIGALVIGDFSYEAFVYPVDRLPQAEIKLRTLAAEFWHAFDRGDQPVINFERDGGLIALMFPQETPGKIIDLSTDNAIRNLLDERERLQAEKKDAKVRLDKCEAEIESKIGDAEGALVPGWKITLKKQTRKAHLVKESNFRVLRTTRLEQQQS